jgi:hypothetical protein
MLKDRRKSLWRGILFAMPMSILLWAAIIAGILLVV